jgi:hypothetical protein
MEVKKILRLSVIFLLIGQFIYTQTEVTNGPDSSTAEIVEAELAAFSLSPFESEPTAVLSFGIRYLF